MNKSQEKTFHLDNFSAKKEITVMCNDMDESPENSAR
jgi:hypothetical protein